MYEYLGVYEDPVGVKIHVWKGPNPFRKKGKFLYYHLWKNHPENSEPDDKFHKNSWTGNFKILEEKYWKLVWSPQDEEGLWV